MLEPIPTDVNFLANRTVNAAIKVHKELGPGLLESVYETCLFYELKKEISEVEKQVKIPIVYDGTMLDADLRLDIWISKETNCRNKIGRNAVACSSGSINDLSETYEKPFGFIDKF